MKSQKPKKKEPKSAEKPKKKEQSRSPSKEKKIKKVNIIKTPFSESNFVIETTIKDAI